LEIIGLAILLGLVVASLAIARFFGFSIRRIALDMLGILLVGTLCAGPGATWWLMEMVQNASGGGPMQDWPTYLLVAGCAVGALAGLFAVERGIYRLRAPAIAWLTSLAGFAAGGLACYFTLLMTQNSGWGEQAWMMISPLCVGTMTLAGYSMKAGTK
jgi:hypothetical protein